jgi:hypothetical protein
MDPNLQHEIEVLTEAARKPRNGATTNGRNGEAPETATLRAAAVTTWPSIAFNTLLGASAAGVAIDALVTPAATPMRSFLRRAAAVGSLAAWGYVTLARPWHRAWGASDVELRSTLRGDGIIPRPTAETTRGITIDTPPKYIWPWLLQLGQGRGGFYSYDWLENVAGLDIHSADEILPQFQSLVVGDDIPFGNGVGIPVVRLEHERTLVLGASIDLATGLPFESTGAAPERFFSMTWAFILKPVHETATRLVARFRIEQRPQGLASATYPLLIEIPHFVMERKMLLGIRERSERLYRRETASEGTPPAS